MRKQIFLTFILPLLVVTSLAVTSYLGYGRYQKSQEAKYLAEIEQVDKTHTVSSDKWDQLVHGLGSNDENKIIKALQICQSIKDPERVTYVITRSVPLINSKYPLVRSCAIITLWKLKAPKAKEYAEYALANDPSNDVRDLMVTLLTTDTKNKKT